MFTKTDGSFMITICLKSNLITEWNQKVSYLAIMFPYSLKYICISFFIETEPYKNYYNHFVPFLLEKNYYIMSITVYKPTYYKWYR